MMTKFIAWKHSDNSEQRKQTKGTSPGKLASCRSKTSARCPLLSALLSLLIIHCSLFIVSCDTVNIDKSLLPLPAPLSVQVTAGSEQLLVNWTKVADAQGREAVYEVYGGYNSDPAAAVKKADAPAPDGNLVSVTVGDLVNGWPYYVWVKAVYGDLGASGFSPMSYGVPAPVPSVPAPALTAVDAMLEASWPAVPYASSYDVYYIEGFYIDETPVGGAIKRTLSDPPADIGGTPTAGLIVTGLANGTEYTLWVRAVNTAGASDFAAPLRATPQAAAAPPPAPGKPKLTAGNGKLTASWPASAGAANYKLYYGTTGNSGAAVEWPPVISPKFGEVGAEITGLGNGSPYYVWVKAYNTAGYSAFSPASDSATPAPPPPINFENINFTLGTATAEYIFSETNPPGPFSTSGELWDRLTRRKETALGNLFCDGAAWYVRANYPQENIDFVFLNGAYLDQPLYKGAVTVGAIESIVPASSRDDFFTIITLTGAEVRALFDHAAAVKNPGRGNSNTGGWGMVSSEVNYTIVYPQPAGDLTVAYYGTIKPGTLKINGQPLNDTATYRVCTANYLAEGGDGYTSFITALTTHPSTAAVRIIQTPVWQGVSEYIYDKAAITPYLDNRVKQEGGGVMCE